MTDGAGRGAGAWKGDRVTNRELFRAAMAFEPTDRICHAELGIWGETHERWVREGLPAGIPVCTEDVATEGPDLYDHFGVMHEITAPIDHYYWPKFEPVVIEDTSEYRLERNDRGIVLRQHKRSMSMPEWIEYPVKGRRDYEALRERLTGSIAERYPADWERRAARMRAQQEHPVRVWIEGFFAFPRELMGLTTFLTTLYDDPGLVGEIVTDHLQFVMRLLDRAIRDVRPDFAFIWEDMCFKNGPLLSPAMFRQFLLPAYRQITGYLRECGVPIIMVDSDGNVSRLIPLWIEGGVTALEPFEVRAGMDVTAVGARYPSLSLVGGIDKTAVAAGRAAIDRELDRVLPAMLARGGYAPTIDHHVPPDVSLADFTYYVERVRSYRP